MFRGSRSKDTTTQRLFELIDRYAELSDEEVALIARVRDVVSRKIAPAAKSHDATGQFPWDNIREINALGLNAMMFPEDYGGYPLSYAAYLMAVREISRGCASTGLTWATNFHATNPIIEVVPTVNQIRTYW